MQQPNAIQNFPLQGAEGAGLYKNLNPILIDQILALCP
jgi:hypothetical protein